MSAERTPAGLTTEELFRAHAPFVARFLFRLGVRPDAIEDTLQEVFLVVLRQGGYRPGPASPTSYLGNVALHAATAYRRREKSLRAREQDGPVDNLAWTGSDPVQVLETSEGLRKLQNALDRLDPDLRTTLVLAELEGESCPSIAAAMGVPVGTVYWRLHRARKKFQHALQVVVSANAPRTLTLQPAGGSGTAGTAENSRKNRAGLMVLMMSSGRDPVSADLFRLGREQPPVRYAVEDGLAHHQHLAKSGAAAPTWGGGLSGAATPATSTTWWVVGIAVVGALGGTGVWQLASTDGGTTMRAAAKPIAISPSVSPSPSASVADRGWIPVPAPAQPVPLPVPPATDPPERPALASRPPSDVAHANRTAASEASARPNAAPDTSTQTSAAPDTQPRTTDAMLELQEVATAERLVNSDPARALSIVRSVETRFPAGFVGEERRYVEIAALTKLGRTAEARGLAAQFLRDYPDGAFSRRVREATRTEQGGP